MADPAPVRLLTPAFVALTLSDLAYFTAAGVLLAATPLFVSGPLSGGPGVPVQASIKPLDKPADPRDGMPDPRIKASGIAEGCLCREGEG